MQPQAGARLPDAGEGRHGRRHRQREGEGGPEGDARIPAAQPSARLPDVRPGRRVLAAGLQLQLRPRVQPAGRSRRTCKPDKDYIGDQITLFTDRCIMCTPLRAVHPRDQRHGRAAGHQPRHARGDRHLPRRAVQQQAGRQRRRSLPGRRAVQQGFPLQAARLVAARRPRASARIAAPAAASTSIENEDHVYRLRPRQNPQAQGHFMCDEGRFGWKYVHSDRRLTHAGAAPRRQPSCRAIGTSFCRQSQAALVAAGRQHGKGIAAVLSPWMTLEEAYLLASYLKSLSPNVTLAMGPVRDRRRRRQVSEGRARPAARAGEVHDPRGEVPEPPRRRSMLRHFAGDVMPMGDVLGRAAAGEFAAAVPRRRRSGRLDHRRSRPRRWKSCRR